MGRKATTLDTLPPVCMGALVTSILMYPVDVVRAICMSNPGTGAGAALRGFLEAHGVMGFVKQGLVAEVTRATISRAIKFFVFPIAHQGMYGRSEKQGNPFTKGTAGAAATIPEVIAISPLENIKLAAQLDKEGKFKGSADIAKHIMRTRGFSGLMTGYAGMQKQALADTFNPEIPRPSALAPLNPGPFFAEATNLAKTRGIGGLYAGVGPKMVHLGGGGALLAVLMPRFKTMYYSAMGIDG